MDFLAQKLIDYVHDHRDKLVTYTSLFVAICLAFWLLATHVAVNNGVRF